MFEACPPLVAWLPAVVSHLLLHIEQFAEWAHYCSLGQGVEQLRHLFVAAQPALDEFFGP